MVMPQKPAGNVRQLPRRLIGSASADPSSQNPTVKPTSPMKWNSSYTNSVTNSASATDTPSRIHSRFITGPSRLRFQTECMPTAISKTSGIIGIRKALPKYGGPTEILPSSMASITSGYSVPSRISPVAATSSALLNSRNASREASSKPASDFSAGARQV